MSLINQMLQDLDKRRASASERGALPNQVRVLPQSEKSNLWWFVAAGAALVSLAVWQFVLPRIPVHAKLSDEEAAVDQRSAKYLDGPASRLALDLAKVPPPKTSAPTRAVVPLPPVVQPQPAARAAEPLTTTATASGVTPPVATSTVVAANSAPPAIATKPAPVISEAKTAAFASSAAVPPTTAIKPRVIDVAADSRVQTALANTQIDKRSQALTPQQLAENDYREAANFLNQGRLAEAQEGFRLALQHNPGHTGARQSLSGLLLEAKKNGEAEQVLQDGLKYNPNQPGLARLLASIMVARGDNAAAIDIMQKSEASALNNPDYLAFLAGLLQRQSRHQEAVDHYEAALRLAPGSGVWLMGLGISLQALSRNSEAQDVFRRAKASNSLSPELQAFVDQRLRQLQ